MSSSALAKRILKNSTIAMSATMEDSKLFDKTVTPTKIPIVNLALSGSYRGGMTSGLMQIAGKSKHFKSGFGLLLQKSFMDFHGEESAGLFYDSEFGTPKKYFRSYEMNLDDIIHSPLTDIEEFKFDIVKQLGEIKRGEKLFILLDSLGNLASKKEVEDAESGKSVADMTRAKSLASVGRMITPWLTIKDIPFVAINHVYKDQGSMHGKQIVSGGEKFYYAADDIWIIGREQEKDTKTKEIEGYWFTINIEKSRFVKEGSKFPLFVSFDSGIAKYSGMLDLAIEAKFVAVVSGSWYSKVDQKTGEIADKKYRAGDLLTNDDFWADILANDKFHDFCSEKYIIRDGKLVADDVDPKLEEIVDEE